MDLRVVARVVLLSIVLTVAPAAPAGAETTGPYHSVVVEPADGTTLSWNDHHYAGSIEITSASDGLVVLDHVSIDNYLLGIQEVPLSWPMEALKAQVVAARTYLAWTLQRGRAGAGSTYGFDICASSACQVYGGLDQVATDVGARWLEAVESTAGEILVYNDAPAFAMYSSTTGGRTRNYEDVYAGREPIPYLKAVASPDESSAFVDWQFEVRSGVLASVLAAADLIDGRLRGITVHQTSDGEGTWTVNIESGSGVTTLSTNEFRSVMNRWGPDVAPDVFPADRPDGKRYPQTVLSPTYVIHKTWHFPEVFPSGHIDMYPVYVFEGHGWGHMVGMSQYGARAMADAGSDYRAILSHYYTGLSPEPGGDLLPQTVIVGLGWGQDTVHVGADGPVDIVIDGETIATGAIGSWDFTPADGVLMTPPEGFGLPPTIDQVPERPTTPTGTSMPISVVVTAPSQVRLVVFRGAQMVQTTEWKAREAGRVTLTWDGTVDGTTAPPGAYRLMIEAVNGEGRAAAFVTALVTN